MARYIVVQSDLTGNNQFHIVDTQAISGQPLYAAEVKAVTNSPQDAAAIVAKLNEA